MARILLIEDSPTEAAVMTQLLERNGHQVTTSGSAEDGIATPQRRTSKRCLRHFSLSEAASTR